MQELHAIVRQVLRFHPRVVRNYADPLHDEVSTSTANDSNMAEVAELLVSELINVLSRGLHEGEELWTVLETLERVPSKICSEDPATISTDVLHRLKFSGQMVYIIKSTFVRCSADLRARALIRLALNQGVVLASLELIARWNAAELSAMYADPAASVLCGVDGELWDAFLRACAPVGGVTLREIEAGAAKGASAVEFDMKLAVPPPAAAPVDERSDDIHRRDERVADLVSSAVGGDAAVSGGTTVGVQRLPVNNSRVAGSKRRVRRRGRKKNSNNTKTDEITCPGAAEEGEKKEDGGAAVCCGEEAKGVACLLPFVSVEDTSSAPGSRDVERLLDCAEGILLERWEKSVKAVSGWESLLLEQEDTA